MRYLSVCSGIEAATVAWHPLGWTPAAFSEIEPFPRAVLAHHYPTVPLHGDFTTIEADQYGPIDLLVGGTPCQSFSIAGLRGGLDDDRGNLALEFLRLAQRTGAKWLVWENVPGVLSSDGGRDFGAILGGMVELGYGFAYRVLNAQFFGVPQRRRRVFVVGCLGDWRGAASVLFERHSLSGHSAPSRQTGQSVAALTATGVGTCGADDNQAQEGHLLNWPADIAPTLNAAFGSKLGLEDQHIRGGADCSSTAKCLTTGVGQRYDPETETLIPMHGGGFDVLSFAHQQGGSINMHMAENMSLALQKSQQQAVAYGIDDVGHCIRSGASKADKSDSTTYVSQGSAVRRLTPRECERLQGFPDDYSLVPYRNKPASDGPRYKALGNSMAVPVMRWIGERIDAVNTLSMEQAA